MTASVHTLDFLGRIEAACQRAKAVTFLDGSEPERVTWEQLHDDAMCMAAALQARGAGSGERVAVLGSTSRKVLTAIQATWLSGAAVIVLPMSARLGSPEEFRRQTRARLELADVALTVSDPDLVPAAEVEPGDPRTITLDELCRHAHTMRPSTLLRPPDDPDATAVVQFTSGSTAEPKGVVIPRRCLIDNIDAAGERTPMDADDDVVVSWIPLYHDMGLVYVAANAMVHGTEMVLAPPARFVASPGNWITWMSEYAGTWTIGPNFGITVSTRLLPHAGPLDLSRCRAWGSGSEPIVPDAMDGMAVAGAAQGLRPEALYSGYGMAEATVAISIGDAGAGFTTDVIDGEVLEEGLMAEPVSPDSVRARRLARCGRPLSGMEVRVTEPASGALLGDRHLGEIEVRGPSVVPGYFRNPTATAATFRPGGWLRTGDLGYLAEGDLVIGGRLKDVIVVGGRNLFPEDLERAAQGVAGVRAGNVIAFGVDAGRRGEGVVVVAELKEGEPSDVRDAVARAVREAVGLRPEEIVLLAPGGLPKTSSGKLRRSICRDRYRAAELEML